MLAVIVLIMVIVIYCSTNLSVGSISTNSISSRHWKIDCNGNLSTVGNVTSTKNVTAANVVAMGDLVTATGLLLPTAGGVATVLSAYEEFAYSSVWTDGTHVTPALVGSVIAVGNTISLKLPNISAAFVEQ